MPSYAATSRIIQGKKGRVVVGALVIHLQRYRLRFHSDDLPNRTFESQGYDEGDFGFQGCDIDFSGNVNANQLPHNQPVPNLRSGVFLQNVIFYLDKAKKQIVYNFAEIRCPEVEISDEAEDKAKISVKAMSNGTIKGSYAVG